MSLTLVWFEVDIQSTWQGFAKGFQEQIQAKIVPLEKLDAFVQKRSMAGRNTSSAWSISRQIQNQINQAKAEGEKQKPKQKLKSVKPKQAQEEKKQVEENQTEGQKRSRS